MHYGLALFCAAHVLLVPAAAARHADSVSDHERALRASHGNGARHGAPATERARDSEGRSPSDDDGARHRASATEREGQSRSDDHDVAAALEAARARATAGDPVAQFSLGAYLYYGTTKTAEGLDWIRRAAEQRVLSAQYHLGQSHEFGFGAAQDDRLALEWYRKAADAGSAPAQRAVGEFHLKGRGVRADAAEAARWFRRAAEGDDLRAQYQLGQLSFDGTGVPRDYQSAYVWFALAAGQTPLVDNRKGILELRDIAAARMTAAAVAAARRRVAAWKPR